MIRAAIYARYSSDKQSERSAEDQARLCRDRCVREGWEVVDIFADLALSGASRNRPSLNALLDRIEAFDVVVAESIDRISRDQEDIAAIWKRLRFAGARLITLSEGEVGEIHVGLGGTMAALYLKQLGEKTRRGQMGRVVAGRIPGGLSYGYAAVRALDTSGRPDRGMRVIDEDQAAIIRRIFADFIAGASPRAIAERLNADGVLSPSAGRWGASTISGNPRRGTGILHNALYVGRIVYNRQRFERHPVTRKRVAKPNPPSDWMTSEVPELAIVDQASWQAVRRRFDHMADVPAQHQRRPKRLFSGLVKCGVCGGGYTVVSGVSWGCSGRREGRGCDNSATISNGELERRILGALREKMLAPDVVAEFIREFHSVLAADRRERLSGKAVLERRLARAQGQLDRIVDAIADGRGAFPELNAKMRQLSAERDQLTGELADLGAEPVLVMIPAIADVYRRKLTDLAACLNGSDVAANEAREQIRSLIDGVVATPRVEGRGVELDLQGRLAAILALTQESRPQEGAAFLRPTLALVAGTGFEPVTFRL